jgi:hypothetical protein
MSARRMELLEKSKKAVRTANRPALCVTLPKKSSRKLIKFCDGKWRKGSKVPKPSPEIRPRISPRDLCNLAWFIVAEPARIGTD